ncbi:MAG: hypothetical protein IKQ40_04295, partial [Lachnospiraceae bacterium]|nr:hypothetical protein [Lachnospiraceae bacterium]
MTDRLQHDNRLKILEDTLKAGVLFVLLITVAIIIYSIVDDNIAGEAPMGSFESEDFNDGWTLITDGLSVKVRLPASVNIREGKEITVINYLPEDLHDGMNLMMRAAMEDVRIYIDEQLRVEYSSASLRNKMYYLPSAWIVTELSEKDAGKKIRIDIAAKSKGIVNTISISDGNNVWFRVIKDGLAVNLIAILVLFLAIIILILTFMIGRRQRVGALRSLSVLMLDVTLWLFSESILRQLFFSRPSLTFYFAYLTSETIGIVACFFFDDVQHRKYHKRYLVIETLAFIQLIINIILNTTGVAEFHVTLLASHFWTFLCIVIPAVCVINDIIRKEIREYSYTAVGMAIFLIFSVGELVMYYASKFIRFGS